MILFLVGMLVALLTNTTTVGQISSLDSEGNISVATVIEWSCPSDNDETCWMVISDQGIETGP
jgi:hypothetical protein